MSTKSHGTIPAPRATVLTLAGIAAAMREFNDGEASAADTLAAIVACVAAHRATMPSRPKAA